MSGPIYGAAVFIVMNFCRTVTHSRHEITLVFAALAERGSRARFVRGLPMAWQPDALRTSPASVPRRLNRFIYRTEESLR